MAGNTRASLVASLASLAAMSVLAAGPTAAADDERGLEFFEKKIRPLLVENCYTCHSAETNSRGGLRVDDRNGLVTGGEHGPAIVPGKPDESRLLRAVSYTDEDLKMPPKKQLSAEQVADLEKWIAEGAAWPAAELPADIGQSNPEYERLRKEHWAWQPLRDARAAGGARCRLAARRGRRLPAGEARRKESAARGRCRSRLTLIRRVTFDLTGLPPTTAEIDGFLADTSIDAFEKVVDRLLASPAFGERWGRHWLDVARYGESTGSSRNLPYPHAWRYRDYVIDAFNDDKPYDQFMREQIAGDLLPAGLAGRARRAARRHRLSGPGREGRQPAVQGPLRHGQHRRADRRGQSRSFLALTASCARCHDHKFDPIPTSRLLRAGRHLPQHRPVRGRAQQDGGRRARLLRHQDARGAGRPERNVRARPGHGQEDRSAEKGPGRGAGRVRGAARQAGRQRAGVRRPAEAGHRPRKNEPPAKRTARPGRSGLARHGGLGRARRRGRRRHRDSHPRRSRKAGPPRAARIPERGPLRRAAGRSIPRTAAGSNWPSGSPIARTRSRRG